MLQSVPMDNAEDSLRLVDHSQNGIITLPNIPVAFLNGLHNIILFTFVCLMKRPWSHKKGFLRFYPSLLFLVFILTLCDIYAAIQSQIWLSACGMAIQGKRTLTNFFGWWILLEAVSDNLASKDMVGLIL